MEGLYKKTIRRLIREVVGKLINEGRDEYELLELEDEKKSEIFSDFLFNNNEDFTKHIPWDLVSFPRLKKIWEDYMATGVVRDVRD